MNLFKKLFSPEKKEDLDKGLEKTKTGFFNRLNRAIAGKSKVDDAVLDNLEEVLIEGYVRAHVSFFFHLKKMLKKRRHINSYPSYYYVKSIGWAFL